MIRLSFGWMVDIFTQGKRLEENMSRVDLATQLYG
jgi:hypothetical protein